MYIPFRGCDSINFSITLFIALVPISEHSPSLLRTIHPLQDHRMTERRVCTWYITTTVSSREYILAIASTAYHRPMATDLPAAAHLRPRHGFVSHSGGETFRSHAASGHSLIRKTPIRLQLRLPAHKPQESAEACRKTNAILVFLLVAIDPYKSIAFFDNFALHFSLRPNICA